MRFAEPSGAAFLERSYRGTGVAHAHPRLPVQAVDRGQVDRRRPVDPPVPPARPPPSTTSTAHPLRAPGDAAAWSSATPHVDGRRAARRHRRDLRSPATTCSWASGYYRYRGGYPPEFPGSSGFEGQDRPSRRHGRGPRLRRQRVVVIGSGATAVTLVPAMADDRRAVTMLQRSPTYVGSIPDADPIANVLRAVLPDGVAYGLTRWKNVLQQLLYWRPERARRGEGAAARHGAQQLGPDYDVAHALHAALRPVGPAALPGARTATCSRRSVRQGLGRHRHDRSLDRAGDPAARPASELDADLIVTATGLELVLLGGSTFIVDGARSTSRRPGATRVWPTPTSPTSPPRSATSTRRGRCVPT